MKSNHANIPESNDYFKYGLCLKLDIFVLIQVSVQKQNMGENVGNKIIMRIFVVIYIFNFNHMY